MFHTLPDNSGDGMKFKILPAAEIAQSFEPRAVRRCIQLRGNDNHRLQSQRFAEGRELAADHLERMDWIIRVGVARVDQMNEKTRAFDVAEKADAEARALVRAFDKARKVGDHKSAADIGAVGAGAAVSVDDAEIRFERRKGIAGDLRARSGNYRNQRGLPSIGEANKANVSKKF